MISFLDVGLQMFGLSAKLAFPFGPSFFFFECILFLSPPCFMPGWKQGSLLSSHGQLSGCELGHWGPGTALLANLTLGGSVTW